jgi:hypothetical protein
MKQHKSVGKQVRSLDKDILNGTVTAAIEVIEFTDIQKAMKAFEQQIQKSKQQHQMIVAIKI